MNTERFRVEFSMQKHESPNTILMILILDNFGNVIRIILGAR